MQFLDKIKKNIEISAPKKKLSPRAILAFLLSSIVAFLLFFSVSNVSQKYFGIRGNIKKLQEDKSILEKKRQNLQEINILLDTPDGIEQSLRNKYNVVKPGEGIIIVTGAGLSDEIPPEKRGVSKWWDDILHGIGVR